MDLSQFNTVDAGEAGATLEIDGPDGEPLFKDDGVTRVTIKLMGADSPSYQRVAHRLAKTGREMRISGRGALTIDPAAAIENKIAVLAACTLSWDGIDYAGVKPFPCNETNAKRLYTDLPWLREQVDAFVQNRMNFLGESSTDS